MVTNIWSTPFIAETAYEIFYYFFKYIQQGHINQYTVGKFMRALVYYTYLPYDDTKYAEMHDNVYKDVHSVCMSPDVAKLMPKINYSQIWSMLYLHGKLTISDAPKQVFGRKIEELHSDEVIDFYQCLADTCDGLGYVKDAALAYENIAKIKYARGDEDAALSNVRAILSLGQVKNSLRLLDTFDKSFETSITQRLFGKTARCSNETRLKSAILRFTIYMYTSQYYMANKTLLSALKKYGTDVNLVAEAVALIRCTASEYNYEDQLHNIHDYCNSSTIRELFQEFSLTTKSVALTIKANMLISLYQNKDYKKASYWAEWYWHAVSYSDGTSPSMSLAKLYRAYILTLNSSKESIYDNPIIGKIIEQNKYKTIKGNMSISQMDVEYRQKLYADAKRFRNMLTEVEKAQYKQYNMTMPQKQYDDEMAELESYRKSLLL